MNTYDIKRGKYLYIKQKSLYRIYIFIYRYLYNDKYLYKGMFKKECVRRRFVFVYNIRPSSVIEIRKDKFIYKVPIYTYFLHNLLKKPSKNAQEHTTVNRDVGYLRKPIKMPLVRMANEKYFHKACYAN